MRNLHPILRYFLAVLVGILSGLMFVALTVGALKLGELLVDIS